MDTVDDINIDDIDFSDLEKQYNVAPDTSSYLDKYVVVDGAPIAPESKAPVLAKVLRKIFSECGEIPEKGIHLPVAAGKTKGFVFIEYTTSAAADQAAAKLNGKKLDVKHRLLVNKLSEVEKYAGESVSEEFEEPELPEFVDTSHLRDWLQDPQGRDQFALQFGDRVGVYWNKKQLPAVPVVESRQNWTSTYVKFSPKGSYMFSVHPQGVQAWGGPGFESCQRFMHPDVRLIDFSPCEKFLVTLSPQPIVALAEDHPQYKSYPFKKQDEGHQLVIWSLSSGLPVRTFALPPHLKTAKEMQWPLIKFSHDDAYCARQGPDAIAVYDIEDDFQLLDKKLVRVEGLADFEWAPNYVTDKSRESRHVISYWTPEMPNQSARVGVMTIPAREVLRTVNLFQVSSVKMHWQDEAKYLCCKVDRHTKSKKTHFTNLELFQLFEKDVPVEKIEFKDSVNNFAWEPRSDRFVTLSRDDSITDVSAAVPRTTLSFFAPDISKKGSATKWIKFKEFEKKHYNTLLFSPKGRFLVAATVALSLIEKSNTEMDFYDMDFDGPSEEKAVSANVKALAHHEHPGLTDASWDSSGRFVAGWASAWKVKIEHGFKIYSFVGTLVKEEAIEQFKSFIWRPRPASLLSAADRKKVRKNLREYSAQFDENDAMEADAKTREVILSRRKMLEEWNSWRSQVEDRLHQLHLDGQRETPRREESIEEIKEEILEEKEEVLE